MMIWKIVAGIAIIMFITICVKGGAYIDEWENEE